MMEGGTRTLEHKLIESLYTETMLLADEARSYFDRASLSERSTLPPAVQVGIACESLKLTTRLMQVIAWLLSRRAVAAGELAASELDTPTRRLGSAADSDAEVVAQMPAAAQVLVAQSLDLHARAARLEAGDGLDDPAPSPARSLLQRLQRSL